VKTIKHLKFCLLLSLVVSVTGCGGSQTIPDWTYTAFDKLEAYKQASLAEKTAVAELHFQSAIAEVKKSGDLVLLARIHLTHYAVQTALLESFDDGEFLKIQAVQSDRSNEAFYAFLKGNFRREDITFLPPQYVVAVKDILDGRKSSLADDLRGISDPLSRLVMTGRLVLSGYEDETMLLSAQETASRQGWKKALLVYLNRLGVYYENRREFEKAKKIKEKIRLIQ
jgi:hypothetical protein